MIKDLSRWPEIQQGRFVTDCLLSGWLYNPQGHRLHEHRRGFNEETFQQLMDRLNQTEALVLVHETRGQRQQVYASLVVTSNRLFVLDSQVLDRLYRAPGLKGRVASASKDLENIVLRQFKNL